MTVKELIKYLQSLENQDEKVVIQITTSSGIGGFTWFTTDKIETDDNVLFGEATDIDGI